MRRTREAIGPDFIIIYRLSMLDLVEGGSSWDEVVQLAQVVEAAGATLINTGVGWHEARIPTIGTMVPRAAFSWVTQRLKGAVNIPLIATNRINDPATAESVLARGDADMVSMARPFLADPDFVKKAERNRADEINTCIGCNQACLDHIFERKIASCLVNPYACRETELKLTPAGKRRRVVVVGAGPAGLACATTAAERGHYVTLFDAAGEIGGQFNLARRIPGKGEFAETLRYYRTRLRICGARIELNRRVTAENLRGFDRVILATGIVPRMPRIPGIDNPRSRAMSRSSTGAGMRGAALRSSAPAASALTSASCSPPATRRTATRATADVTTRPLPRSATNGALTPAMVQRGGLKPAQEHPSPRRVWLLQRKSEKVGNGLAKTTGWIRRAILKKRCVAMLPGVHYEKIDDGGLHITVDGEPELLDVDTIVICAGQEPQTRARRGLEAARIPHQLIGGADIAVELDAKRAIEQGTRVALEL